MSPDTPGPVHLACGDGLAPAFELTVGGPGQGVTVCIALDPDRLHRRVGSQVIWRSLRNLFGVVAAQDAGPATPWSAPDELRRRTSRLECAK